MLFSAGSSAESYGRPSAAAVREARRVVYSRVRNDWEFPPPCTPAQPTEASDLPSKPSSPSPSNGVKEDEHADATSHAETSVPVGPAAAAAEEGYGIESDRVAEWRERNYGSSDPSTAEESETVDWTADSLLKFSPNVEQNRQSRRRSLRKNPTSRRTRAKRTIKAGLRMDPLGRDSQKQDVQHNHHQEDVTADDSEEENKREEVRNARKARRRRRIEEEMSWNEGLSHWMKRRDAWTCARNVHPVDATGPKTQGCDSQDDEDVKKTSVPLASVLNMHHPNKKSEDVARDEKTDPVSNDVQSSSRDKMNDDVRPATIIRPH